MLIQHQMNRLADPTLHGSWNPVIDAQHGGRAYSTAIGCLCLEVYYRYRPLYEVKR